VIITLNKISGFLYLLWRLCSIIWNMVKWCGWWNAMAVGRMSAWLKSYGNATLVMAPLRTWNVWWSASFSGSSVLFTYLPNMILLGLLYLFFFLLYHWLWKPYYFTIYCSFNFHNFLVQNFGLKTTAFSKMMVTVIYKQLPGSSKHGSDYTYHWVLM